MTGLVLTASSLLTGLLFSSLDTSIVSTSLVTVSQDLNDFVNAPWIVLAYLLTYMGMNPTCGTKEVSDKRHRVRCLHFKAQRHLRTAKHARDIVGVLRGLFTRVRISNQHDSTVSMVFPCA